MSKVYYTTYADSRFENKLYLAEKSAKYIGKFDDCFIYRPSDISKDFTNKNSEIFNCKKGGGYWLWKPYIILESLKRIEENDYLFYTDSAVVFINDIEKLISKIKNEHQPIFGFETPLIEKQWTKFELIQYLDCKDRKYLETNQLVGGLILIRKNNESIEFFNKYLDVACEDGLINDSLNKANQYEEFIEHRHDQSIFSLLFKKKSYKVLTDPSQFGKYPMQYTGCTFENKVVKNKLYYLKNGRMFRLNESSYKLEIILFLYRKSNFFIAFFKFLLKLSLKKAGLYNGKI